MFRTGTVTSTHLLWLSQVKWSNIKSTSREVPCVHPEAMVRMWIKGMKKIARIPSVLPAVELLQYDLEYFLPNRWSMFLCLWNLGWMWLTLALDCVRTQCAGFQPRLPWVSNV